MSLRRNSLLGGLVAATVALTPLAVPAQASPAGVALRAAAPVTVDNVAVSFGRTDPVAVTLSSTGENVTAIHYTVGRDPETPTFASPVYDPEVRPVLRHGERVSYFAVDAAGGAETPHTSAPALIDTEAPSTVDDVPAAGTDSTGAGSGGVPVTLSATDAETSTSGASGVAIIYYTVGRDPEAPTTSSPVYDPEAKPVLSVGQRISYFAVDAVDNAETPRTSSPLPGPVEAPPTPDTLAPTTTDDVPADHVGGTDRVAVTLTAVDAGSGVREIRYEIFQGSLTAPVTLPLVYDPANRPTLSDGQSIAYAATDNAGNVETVRHSSPARIDSLAPSTSDDVPGGFVGKATTVTLRASDRGGSGVDRIVYAIASDTGSVVPTMLYRGPVLLTDGQRIVYTATDRAGNAEEARTSKPLRVDQTAPATTDNVPTGPQTAPIRVTLTASDGAGSGVREVRYAVSRVGSGPAAPTTVYESARPPVLRHGEVITYAAVDAVGNAETPHTSAAANVPTRFTTSPELDNTVPVVGDTIGLQRFSRLPTSASVSYQWVRVTAGGLRPVGGADSGPTLKVGQDLVGSTLTVVVTLAEPGYASTTSQAPVTAPVSPGPIPGTTLRIDGVAKANGVLTAVTSLDSDPGVRLSYEWQEFRGAGDGSVWRIKSTRTRSFDLTGVHVGHRLRVRVVARKAGYEPTIVGGGFVGTAPVEKGTICRKRKGVCSSIPVSVGKTRELGLAIQGDYARYVASFTSPRGSASDFTTKYQWFAQRKGVVHRIGNQRTIPKVLGNWKDSTGKFNITIDTAVWVTVTLTSDSYPTRTQTSPRADFCGTDNDASATFFRYKPCENQEKDGHHHSYD